MSGFDATRGQMGPLDFLRSGQTTFFRLPAARPDGGPLDDALRGAGAVILGVPWDGGTTLHAGAREAPWAVRTASVGIPGYSPHAGLDVFQALRAVDGGNIAVSSLLPDLMHATVEGEVAQALAACALPFLVGGDHSITLPALRAVRAAHGPVAIIHVDAHADTSDGSLWGGAHHHGTWLRTALEEGLVDVAGLLQVGLRGPWKASDEHDVVLEAGGRVITMEQVDALGIGAVAEIARRRCGPRPTWITFDIDGVDPGFAPGTGTPVSGGLTSREALGLLRALQGVALCGMDVVEVCPGRDAGGVTALLAAHILWEGLALGACRERSARVTAE